VTAALRRVCLFGGAFDPPHRAHQAIAQAAVQQLQLDELRICPTGDAWHKPRQLTDAEHRLEMARIAFRDLPNTVIDDREIRRTGPSYTIDTLRELRAEQPHSRLFLLMGEDQAAAFTTWREWREIAHLVTLAVARRDYAGTRQTALSLPQGATAVELKLPILPESATAVRQRLTAGQDIAELVDPRVASYIARHHLYTSH
jgi:nicotinate-nucleotide adenylyltransferase